MQHQSDPHKIELNHLLCFKISAIDLVSAMLLSLIGMMAKPTEKYATSNELQLTLNTA